MYNFLRVILYTFIFSKYYRVFLIEEVVLTQLSTLKNHTKTETRHFNQSTKYNTPNYLFVKSDSTILFYTDNSHNEK